MLTEQAVQLYNIMMRSEDVRDFAESVGGPAHINPYILDEMEMKYAADTLSAISAGLAEGFLYESD